VVTHILQNIFLFVQQKNEIHTGLKQLVGELFVKVSHFIYFCNLKCLVVYLIHYTSIFL